jgi:hypothetical protein
MRRRFGTTTKGAFFEAPTVAAVWSKARLDVSHPGYARDACGTWMQYVRYGDTSSRFGWEIDHTQPVVAGGTDDLSNLQPLQWENNHSKGDDWPDWTCTSKPGSVTGSTMESKTSRVRSRRRTANPIAGGS